MYCQLIKINIMQKFILSLVILTAVLFAPTDLLAQKSKKVLEAEFLVDGVCNMCKKRIETATYDLPGVKWVEWDKYTKKLSVKYKASKVSLDEIHVAIAKVGHDTSKKKSTEETYNNLPGCCQYKDDEVHTH